MKQISKITLGLVIALSAALITGQVAFAHGGDGDGDCPGMGLGGFRGHMMGGDRFGLVPEEMREQFKADWQNLSDEERTANREEWQARREQNRAQMEEFVGLTREEMRAARQNGQTMGEILDSQGVTQSEAEQFLTGRANDRVDTMVERHDLSSEQEQTLRDRIAEWVQNILNRWFGN